MEEHTGMEYNMNKVGMIPLLRIVFPISFDIFSTRSSMVLATWDHRVLDYDVYIVLCFFPNYYDVVTGLDTSVCSILKL